MPLICPRNACDGIACLAYETAQAVAFGTEHYDQRVGFETGFANEGVTVVIEQSAVYFGGIDITDDVIQELKKKAAGK